METAIIIVLAFMLLISIIILIDIRFDIKGLKLKVFENVVEETEKIELELNEEAVKKKKVTNKSDKEIYFDKELDNKLLNEYYSKKDIMEISKKNNVKPWQVVSLLIKYKIITKRDQAIGYDKYKETEEYKQKIKEK